VLPAVCRPVRSPRTLCEIARMGDGAEVESRRRLVMRSLRLGWTWVVLLLVAGSCGPRPDTDVETDAGTEEESGRDLPPGLGDKLPDSRLQVLEAAGSGFEPGAGLALSDFEGKPIVLDFWASWCGNCRQQHQQVAELKELYGDRIEVIGVLFRDSRSNGLRWLEEHGSTYLTVTEEANVLGEEFWLGALPYFALLTPDRRLSWDYLGLSATGIPDSVTVRLDRMLGS